MPGIRDPIRRARSSETGAASLLDRETRNVDTRSESRLNTVPAQDLDAGYTLLVSDSERDRPEIEGVLRAAGLAVAGATFDELFALPDVAPPRLVVFDGDHDTETRRHRQDRLRRHPRLRAVPLLVLGEGYDPKGLAVAIAHGASAYIAKPLSSDVLVGVAGKLVSYRADPEAEERRRHPRRPLLVPVDFEVEARQRRSAGWIMDACPSGCRVEVSDVVSRGEAVRVWLPAAEATAHLPLTGTAAWSHQQKGGLSTAGIRFTGTTPLLAGITLGLE